MTMPGYDAESQLTRNRDLENRLARRRAIETAFLRLLLKASGKQGVPQGGVISPLLSNVYLNEVDKMLEKAKEVTRQGRWMRVEYARFADDLVVLVNAHPRQAWLRKAVEKRLREELAKLQVEVNKEKSRRVDLQQGESFGFLGFEFRRIRSRRGRWMPLRTPRGKKRTALLRMRNQAGLPKLSLSARDGIDRADQSHVKPWATKWLGLRFSSWIGDFRDSDSLFRKGDFPTPMVLQVSACEVPALCQTRIADRHTAVVGFLKLVPMRKSWRLERARSLRLD